MIVYCNRCERPIRTGEEVQFVAHAFFKELGSKVAYSVSTPHLVDKETMRHDNCPEPN